MKKVIGFLALFLICFIASDQRISSQISTNILGNPTTNPIIGTQIDTPWGYHINYVSLPPFIGNNIKSQERKSKYISLTVTSYPFNEIVIK